MKDGSTHLAHKCEHAVDLDTGAVVGVTLHGGTTGDTHSVPETLERVEQNVTKAQEDEAAAEKIEPNACQEVVMDKGYHSNDTLIDLRKNAYRTYISEPDRGRRDWKDKEEEKAAVYANRRRIRGARGKRLMRKRGELLERPFAQYANDNGMRRVHLRGHRNILKRLLIHVAGLNLGLLMRKLVGVGTPRGLHDGVPLSELCQSVVKMCHWILDWIESTAASAGEDSFNLA